MTFEEFKNECEKNKKQELDQEQQEIWDSATEEEKSWATRYLSRSGYVSTTPFALKQKLCKIIGSKRVIDEYYAKRNGEKK